MQSNMNRRTVLAGAAAIPCATLPALPALANEPDPIFTAINAYLLLQAEHDAAWGAYTGAADAIAPIPEFNDDEAEGWRKECDRRWSLVRAAPHIPELAKRADETGDRAAEAAEVVYDNMPTTAAGLIFLLKTLTR